MENENIYDMESKIDIEYVLHVDNANNLAIRYIEYKGHPWTSKAKDEKIKRFQK